MELTDCRWAITHKDGTTSCFETKEFAVPDVGEGRVVADFRCRVTQKLASTPPPGTPIYVWAKEI